MIIFLFYRITTVKIVLNHMGLLTPLTIWCKIRECFTKNANINIFYINFSEFMYPPKISILHQEQRWFNIFF